MGVKENLIAAKALIDTPEKWLSRRTDGANRLSILGALSAVDADGPTYEAMLTAAEGVALARLNSSSTHADIMALFDRAIAAAEAQP